MRRSLFEIWISSRGFVNSDSSALHVWALSVLLCVICVLQKKQTRVFINICIHVYAHIRSHTDTSPGARQRHSRRARDEGVVRIAPTILSQMRHASHPSQFGLLEGRHSESTNGARTAWNGGMGQRLVRWRCRRRRPLPRRCSRDGTTQKREAQTTVALGHMSAQSHIERSERSELGRYSVALPMHDGHRENARQRRTCAACRLLHLCRLRWMVRCFASRIHVYTLHICFYGAYRRRRRYHHQCSLLNVTHGQ